LLFVIFFSVGRREKNKLPVVTVSLKKIFWVLTEAIYLKKRRMILFFTYGIITISVNRQRFDVKKQKFICAPRLFTF